MDQGNASPPYYDQWGYSSSPPIIPINSSSMGPSPSQGRKKNAGKKQENYSEALKEPIIIGIKKAKEANIICLNRGDERLFTSPNVLAKKYFEPNTHFPLIDGKTQKYYEYILIETGSIRFHHSQRDKYYPDNFSFSKAFIHKVMNITDWGLNPNRSKKLKVSYQDYNYWDYIEAFTKAFYYNNTSEKHSWFIRLKLDIIKQELPYWFYHWFDIFGPEKDYFPEDLLRYYDYFIINDPRLKGVKVIKGSNMLHFLAQFSLPWIWQWTYSVSPSPIGTMTLTRSFYYKWWGKFDFAPVLKKISERITAFEEAEKKKLETAQQAVKKELHIPSLQDLKEMFPEDSPKFLKQKLLKLLSSQFDDNFEKLFGKDSSTSKMKSDMEEDNKDYAPSNEDMEDYVGIWIDNLDQPNISKPKDEASPSQGQYVLRKIKGKDKV